MSNRKKFASVVSNALCLAVSLSWFCLTANAAVDDALDLRKAIASYNASNFGDAIGYSQMYIKDHPRDGMAHYYLANALHSLGHDSNALAEYNLALSCSNSSVLTGYCKQAIQSLAPASASSSPASPSQWSDPAYARFHPLHAALRKPLPTNDAKLDKVINRMQSQADIASQTYTQRVDTNAKAIQNGYTWQIQEVRRKADEEIANIEANPNVTNKGKVVPRTAEMTQARERADATIKDLQVRAELDARNLEMEKSQTVQNFQREVRQWQDQVVASRQNRNQGSAPAISLAGTDLYTRTYDVNMKPPAPEPEEMLATPDRLVLDPHSSPGHTISRIVREPNPAKEIDPNTALKVQGRLMPD